MILFTTKCIIKKNDSKMISYNRMAHSCFLFPSFLDWNSWWMEFSNMHRVCCIYKKNSFKCGPKYLLLQAFWCLKKRFFRNKCAHIPSDFFTMSIFFLFSLKTRYLLYGWYVKWRIFHLLFVSDVVCIKNFLYIWVAMEKNMNEHCIRKNIISADKLSALNVFASHIFLQLWLLIFFIINNNVFAFLLSLKEY